ncbi:30S ribosomal protein S20 [Anaerosalibacter sp. Marseille-P3206]|uniref:30S ribosomal protein S20 n=1 Tax=Anaerosalibacter sp. Marseille-P3206 TaxID=1871005 RepID=UPI000984EED7|nr:30S ribosomal protein S20 [Anaerosalibacter sp. Marseille-P3206]
MANIKSAVKRIRVTETKTETNRMRKSEIKTYMRKFDEAIENGNFEEANELIKIIDRKLKKAVAKNTVHKNVASRRISHLTKKLNTLKNEAV